MERKIEQIHVIIPSLNEEVHIEKLLNQLIRCGFGKISVVDAQSTDRTAELVEKFTDVELITSKEKGRAVQMNLGAKGTKFTYLLFLHADTSLPSDFVKNLERFIKMHKAKAASFFLKFNSSHWFLKLNENFSRFNFLPFQFGDQGLLIQKEYFEKVNGFNEDLLFMEGNDMVKRIKKITDFQKIPISLTVSARKYERYGVFRLQFSYYLIYLLSSFRLKQKSIQKLFSKVL